jgi:type 1 fimbria pilin
MKMKKWLIGLTITPLVACPAGALAYTNTVGAVARIFPSGDSNIYFRLADDQCNVASSGDYYYFSTTHAQAKNWYAVLLLASASGKQITVSVNDCATGNKAIRYLLIDP